MKSRAERNEIHVSYIKKIATVACRLLDLILQRIISEGEQSVALTFVAKTGRTLNVKVAPCKIQSSFVTETLIF